MDQKEIELRIKGFVHQIQMGRTNIKQVEKQVLNLALVKMCSLDVATTIIQRVREETKE